ncbi:MAG: hypothetical protein EXQ58_00435 [Acidobacteria bacterium]|nr:hypothetical protein [Acidobacteriota bacterium]
MWGIEVNGHHTEEITSIGKASQITAWDAAGRLGIQNLMMCGAGQLTPTESHAGQITHFRRVVWELHDFDDPAKGASNLAAIQSVAARHHNVEAVLLDDMTSLAIGKRGMEPTILAKLARQLQERPRPLMLWGVVYTMNLELPRKGVPESFERRQSLDLGR